MLKTPLKLLVAASVALPSALAFSVQADAGHTKKSHYKSHHYAGGVYYAPRYKRHHHKRNYYHSRHRGHGYYYGGHHRHRGGKAGKYLGVAILGLGVGYLLSKSAEKNRDYRDERYEDRYDDRDDYYRDEDRSYRDEDRRRYSSPPPRGYTGAQDQPDREPYASQSFDFSQCTETREYQTTIIVDGFERQAFGTACLMEDGTWVAGPMQIEQ